MTTVIKPVITSLAAGTQVKKAEWDAVPNGGNGDSVSMVDYPDVCVVIDGAFGVGGSCTLKGSMDGTNFYPLTNPQGNVITMTSAGIATVIETPEYIAPFVTAGDGTTAINVSMMLRRASR